MDMLKGATKSFFEEFENSRLTEYTRLIQKAHEKGRLIVYGSVEREGGRVIFYIPLEGYGENGVLCEELKNQGLLTTCSKTRLDTTYELTDKGNKIAEALAEEVLA